LVSFRQNLFLRKRRRLALAADYQARRRKISTTRMDREPYSPGWRSPRQNVVSFLSEHVQPSHRVEPPNSTAAELITAFGASSSLPSIPAKVALPNRQRALSLGRGNASSCPIPAVRNTRRDRREHTLEREAHKMRIVLLAEMILNLQDVPGFDACVGQMLNRDLIESTYAELEIARRLYNGVP
jgi:hypothetical protein